MSLTKNDKLLIFLLILLVVGTSVLAFFDGRQNYEITLFLQLLTALASGLVFGRRREKRNLLFLLIGAVLLVLWSELLKFFSLPPPGYLLTMPELRQTGWFSEFEVYHIWPRLHFSNESVIFAVPALLLGVYLLFWTARHTAGSKRGGLLLGTIFLSLPAILLPAGMVIAPFFLSENDYNFGNFMTYAMPCSAALALIPFLAVFILSLLKIYSGWKKLLTVYGCIFLVSVLSWGIFNGIEAFLRNRMLTAMRIEKRAMTLEQFYGITKDTKDGTGALLEIVYLMKEKNFDTSDFPFNSGKDWLTWKNTGKLRRERKEEMIRISEGPQGEQLTKQLLELAKYNRFRLGNFYTDHANFFRLFREIRRMTRTAAGRAAIAHYTGKTEEILPRLKAALNGSRPLYRQPYRIASVEHAAVDFIVISQAVMLGPVGPKYAADYRELLERIRQQDYLHSWIVTENCAERLDKAEKIFRRSDWLASLLIRPLELKGARLNLQRELRREQYFVRNHDMEPDDPARKGLLELRDTQGVMTVALALKLYRCLHEKYPDSLAALVPEILPKLPLDSRFEYVRRGDSFKIRGKPAMHSRPNY